MRSSTQTLMACSPASGQTTSTTLMGWTTSPSACSAQPRPERRPSARARAHPLDPLILMVGNVDRCVAHLPEDDDPFFAPVPADIPAVVSFASAGGRTWAQPTAAAMSKAMKIIQDVEHDVAVDEGLPKRRRIEPPSSFPMPSSFPPPSTPAPARSGFAGAAPASQSFMSAPRPSQTSGFQLGSGSTAPQVAASRARALALFGEEEAAPAAGPSTMGGFQSGSGRAVAAPSSQSMARALAIFNDLEEAGPSSTPIRRPSSPQPFSTQKPQSDFSTPVRQTGSRVPLSSKTNLPNAFRTPASTKLPKRIEIGTPGVTPRRIGLGGTPGGKPVRKGFVTPFRVPGSASATQTKTTLSALRTPLKPPPEPKKIYESVFNLERKWTRSRLMTVLMDSSREPQNVARAVPLPGVLFSWRAFSARLVGDKNLVVANPPGRTKFGRSASTTPSTTSSSPRTHLCWAMSKRSSDSSTKSASL